MEQKFFSKLTKTNFPPNFQHFFPKEESMKNSRLMLILYQSRKTLFKFSAKTIDTEVIIPLTIQIIRECEKLQELRLEFTPHIKSYF